MQRVPRNAKPRGGADHTQVVVDQNLLQHRARVHRRHPRHRRRLNGTARGRARGHRRSPSGRSVARRRSPRSTTRKASSATKRASSRATAPRTSRMSARICRASASSRSRATASISAKTSAAKCRFHRSRCARIPAEMRWCLASDIRPSSSTSESSPWSIPPSSGPGSICRIACCTSVAQRRCDYRNSLDSLVFNGARVQWGLRTGAIGRTIALRRRRGRWACRSRSS